MLVLPQPIVKEHTKGPTDAKNRFDETAPLLWLPFGVFFSDDVWTCDMIFHQRNDSKPQIFTIKGQTAPDHGSRKGSRMMGYAISSDRGKAFAPLTFVWYDS